MSRNIFDVLDAEYQKNRQKERDLGWFLLKLTLLNSINPGILMLLIGIVASLFFGPEAVFVASNFAAGTALVVMIASFRTRRMVLPQT